MLLVLASSAGCNLEGLAKGTDSSEDDNEKDDDEPEEKKKKKKKKGKKGKKKNTKKGDETREDDAKSENAPAQAPAPTQAVDYFADATSVPKLLTAKLGGGSVRLKELLIYPTYGHADIQDRNKPLNLDRFDFRDGRVKEPTPIRLFGPKPTEALMRQNTFDMSSVDFSVVPKIVADAKLKLGYESGKTTHMILKRNIPFDTNVGWRVYVTGERRSGSVSFDLKGATIKVYD